MSSPSDPNEFTQRAPVSKVTRGLPEDIISFGGRWVAIKQFPSGDIAVKVVSWDPDLVSLVKNLAQAHGGRYNPRHKTWNVPQRSAHAVRHALLHQSKTLQIRMGPMASSDQQPSV